MRPSLLPLLACPSCKGSLSLTTSRASGDDVEEGSLACGCGRRYAIVRGIPRFVPTSLEEDKRATADAFGWQWTHFDEITPDHEQQFLDWIAPVTAADFAGKLVLDGGCGKGRHLACAARFGAAQAVGVDLSDAVEAARRNVRSLPNAHVVQADMYALPFRDATFDLAYSVGVLHHLPDPKGGFDALVRLVKPAGRMVAWVYGRENNGWIVHAVTPFREHVASRLPRRVLDAIATALTALALWPAVKLVYGPLHRAAPALSAKVLPYEAYLAYASRFSFRELRTIVFDHLVAPTAFYIPREEFEAWFRREDLEPPTIGWHNRNSWRGTALRRG